MGFVVTGTEWIAAGAGHERAGDSADRCASWAVNMVSVLVQISAGVTRDTQARPATKM